MAYATIEDVRRLMAQFPIDSASSPTEVQVNAIIADTEHEVTTKLSARGVAIPVESPASFVAWLGLLISYGATAAVLKSMFPDATGPAETPAYAFWEARYKAGIKGIEDGTLIPIDVARGSRIAPSTYLTENPERDVYLGANAEPFFSRRFLG